MTAEAQVYLRISDRLLWMDGKMAVELEHYRVIRRTAKGVWITRGPFRIGDMVLSGGWGSPSGKPRFILDGEGRRFAYATVEAAVVSYRRRKEVQVSRLETDLIKARAALGFSARPDFKPDTVFQDETLRIFREY